MSKPSFQNGVASWLVQCFGPIVAADKVERSDRFIEEAFELVQSVEYPLERVLALLSYVYGRPPGDPRQEVGGVMVTLASFCLSYGINLDDAAHNELDRVWTKIDEIRAKQARKPVGSALPTAGRTPLTEIKRYDVATIHRAGGQPRGEMIEAQNGEFIHAEDMSEVASHFYLIGREHGVRETKASGRVGWIYDNEDTGREFSDCHPVDSGEVSDATNIVPANAANLLSELQSSWRAWNEDRIEIAGLRNAIARNDVVRAALADMVDYYSGVEDAEVFPEEASRLARARAALEGGVA